jgi:ABC-type branched-subunit amino acid transport system substrate-binding protein
MCPARATAARWNAAASAGARRSRAACTSGDPTVVFRRRAREGTLVNARLTRCTLLTLALVLAACGSGTKTGSPEPTTPGSGSAGSNAPISKEIGPGVTDTTIKIGVALVDFECIAPYIQISRKDEYKVYDAFIADINAKGGVAGRKLVPVYRTFCPIVPAPALALCTQFTEDDEVFAVIGNFVDLTGQAQPCIAKQHDRVLITINLTQEIIDSAPGGMILGFAANKERGMSILLSLLESEGTLDGKKVAVLGEATTAQAVKNVLVPGLKQIGADLGTTAIITISGSDTAAASAQLMSFIEKWKTEGVDTVFLSGVQVSAQQFVPDLVKRMPGVQLLADNATVNTYGQNLQEAGVRPNPYEGIIAVGGVPAKQYDQSDNWKYCAAIYEKHFHETAPNQDAVIPGPPGHTLDVNGSILDACTELSMFHDIGERVGKYLNSENWRNVVDHFGKIRLLNSLYGSIHAGKYDANDTFALVAYDSSIPPVGNWRYLTEVKDLGGD